MKTHHIIINCLILIFFCANLNAQPYTLNNKLKPITLKLLDDKSVKDAKGVITNATIKTESQFYHVVGLDLFQFVDIYIFSNYGNPDFKVELANTNWGDVVNSGTTATSENGIINFKVRLQGSFGIQVFPGKEAINYSIAVYASPPKKEYLGSAFVKATNRDLYPNGKNTSNSISSSTSDSSNKVSYIIIGIALLVIGFLLSKVLGKNKIIGLVLLCMLFIPQDGYSQMHNGTVWDIDAVRDGRYSAAIRDRSGNGVFDDISQLNKGLSRLGKLNGYLNKALDTYNKTRKLYDSYKGLSDCMSSTPPPGMPRVPSFCETDDCSNCFKDARRRFNKNRYTFEQLKTIYSCTKNFTDNAIAFGDNVSGYHGVSGLAWQSQKIGVLKSVIKLKDAYDKKYVELLESQQEILMELNSCEAAHGIPDWYDRFGYLYYEFTKMNYRRPN